MPTSLAPPRPEQLATHAWITVFQAGGHHLIEHTRQSEYGDLETHTYTLPIGERAELHCLIGELLGTLSS